MGELKHCYRCMEEINEDLNICPSCGYDASTPNNPMYITPGTLLREKYLCGVLLEYNGEGATYIGKDITTGNKVKIREYMPINLCTRIKNRSAISVNYNNLAKYKAFMAEYTELNKSLAKLRNNPNIITVLDMFAENNTTYTVFKYTDSVKLLDYLKENAGELSWDQVSRIFPPLFNAIGILHNAGITHRAISPDTVYINDKEELTLCGFSVSSARTVNAGLEYELFKGYAAPEQYSASSNSRQGTWTDVYGVCALLYRALTGCMPIDSVTRLKHDDLHEPCVLDSRIPSHVSAVIMRGMSLSGRDRIQTITELVTKLFEQPSDDDDTATLDYSAADALRDAQEQQPRPVPQPEYAHRSQEPRPRPRPQSGAQRSQHPQQGNAKRRPPQSSQNGQRRRPPERYREEEYRYERESTAEKIKTPLIIGILLVAILLILGVLVYNVLYHPEEEEDPRKKRRTTSVSDEVSEEAETTTNESNIEMPNLIGRFFDQEVEKWSEFFTIEPTYELTDSYDIDIIYDQDIDVGTMISKGDVVKVTVAKGRMSSFIPDFEGMNTVAYKKALEKAGIPKDHYEFVEAKFSYGNPDSVIELKIGDEKAKPGAIFDNKSDKKLSIYYIPGSGSSEVYTTAYQAYYTTANYSAVTTNQYGTTGNSGYTPVYTTQAEPIYTDPPQQPVVTDPPQQPVITDPPTPVVPETPQQPVEQPQGGGDAPAE